MQDVVAVMPPVRVHEALKLNVPVVVRNTGRHSVNRIINQLNNFLCNEQSPAGVPLD